MFIRSFLLIVVSVWIFSATAIADAGQDRSVICPNMTVSEWGVLDYRKVDPERLRLVERYHFTPEVEQLTSHRSGSDLSYTLNRFQNHHRALMSLMNLSLREGASKPRGVEHTVECYLLRAEVLFPDDAMVRTIHGLLLMRTGKISAAVDKLENARAIEANDANLHYNLGLAYVQLGQYDKALESARRAYALGFPLPGLRNQLQRAGKWKD